MTKLSHPGSSPYLPGQLFPAGSDTQCPPKGSVWKVDSMFFPLSPITPKSGYGQRSYDLPKLEVTHDLTVSPGQLTLLARTAISVRIRYPMPSKGIQI